MLLLAQAVFPDMNINFNKIGEVALVAIALIYLARTFMSFVNNTGKKDEREDGILKQMIDLAQSYKQESAEARDAYKAEAAANRAVVQESNDVLRTLIEATNIQTGEIRKLPTSIDALRADFKNYQVINADEIEGFGRIIETLQGEMVSFKGEVQASIDKMLQSIDANNTFVQKISNEVHEAVNDHQVIIDAGKQILRRCDEIIALLPPPPPNVTVINTAPTEGSEAA